MELKNIVHKYGHFYDQKGSRVKFKDGITLSISVSENDMLPIIPIGKEEGSLNKIEQSEKEGKFLLLDMMANGSNEFVSLDGIRYHRIFKKGDSLFFAIKRRGATNTINHEFRVELFEDLYFYLKGSKKDERLFDCECVVRENVSKTLDFFEEIYGKSLNQVFKNTYVHFFENMGAPSGNAIARFYETQGEEDTTIERHRKT